jgi:hypothetical protein
MSNGAEEEVTQWEVAQYVGDMAMDLARLAREAGLVAVAAGLEQCHRAAMAEVQALKSKRANTAPKDTA